MVQVQSLARELQYSMDKAKKKKKKYMTKTDIISTLPSKMYILVKKTF